MYEFPKFLYLGAVRCRELYILRIATTYNSCKFRVFLKPPPPPPSPPPPPPSVPLPPVAIDLSSSPGPVHFETTAVPPCTFAVPRPISMSSHSSSNWKPHTDKPYRCSKCGKGLSHMFTLNRHRRTVCGKVRNSNGKWKCEHCTRTYKTEGNLARHIRYECDVPRQFHCIFCNRAFTQRCSLSRHLKKFHNQSADGVMMQRDQAFEQSGNVDSDSAYCSSESVCLSI
ncbi:PREDICTED: zinc finger protein 787-like [Dinoponera quadriceps]|uniref:Zinc finger protein 787-like n=1 Tax=Dinoponera quadriceps TaxID=609295 RepID=A0A6P3XX76_DINQU|nr:PREDICTED: zinc finger protein 787-like [Dinoponera quadriceps]